MTGDKSVVTALIWLREAGNSAVLAQCGEAIAPPGQDLMGVALMPDVKNDAIRSGIVNAMQRNGELNRAQIGREMPAGL